MSYYYLIVMARTAKIMLNNSDKSGHPCLVPDLKGNVFSFSPLRMIYAVFLYICIYFHIYTCIYIFIYYYDEADSCYAHFLETLFYKWVLTFVKSFFCINCDDCIISLLQFVNIMYHIDWFAFIEELLACLVWIPIAHDVGMY